MLEAYSEPCREVARAGAAASMETQVIALIQAAAAAEKSSENEIDRARDREHRARTEAQRVTETLEELEAAGMPVDPQPVDVGGVPWYFHPSYAIGFDPRILLTLDLFPDHWKNVAMKSSAKPSA